jgi:hypothetical protein
MKTQRRQRLNIRICPRRLTRVWQPIRSSRELSHENECFGTDCETFLYKYLHSDSCTSSWRLFIDSERLWGVATVSASLRLA